MYWVRDKRNCFVLTSDENVFVYGGDARTFSVGEHWRTASGKRSCQQSCELIAAAGAGTQKHLSSIGSVLRAYRGKMMRRKMNR